MDEKYLERREKTLKEIGRWNAFVETYNRDLKVDYKPIKGKFVCTRG